MKLLKLLVSITFLLFVIFGLSRVAHKSSDLSHTSAIMLAQSDTEQSLFPDETKVSPSAKQPRSSQGAVNSPAQVKTNKHVFRSPRELISSAWKADQQPELTAFAQWTERLIEPTDVQRVRLIPEGVELAEQRRVVLAELIRSDPERALAVAVPLAVRTRLPGEITTLLEQRVSGRGDLHLVEVTPALGQKLNAPLSRFAIINQHTYQTSDILT